MIVLAAVQYVVEEAVVLINQRVVQTCRSFLDLSLLENTFFQKNKNYVQLILH